MGWSERYPKGYYFNRCVYRFGRMVESDLRTAEAKARKNRKGQTADRMANGARLGVLEKHLKEPMRKFRDPIKTGAIGKSDDKKKPDLEDTVTRWKI